MFFSVCILIVINSLFTLKKKLLYLSRVNAQYWKPIIVFTQFPILNPTQVCLIILLWNNNTRSSYLPKFGVVKLLLWESFCCNQFQPGLGRVTPICWCKYSTANALIFFRITVEGCGLGLDIPPEYSSTSKFRSTLGHKINNSFYPNSFFVTLDSPRWCCFNKTSEASSIHK